METTHIYLMPGMAASPKIFEFLEFPESIQPHWLSWIPPEEEETIQSYAARMCERIEHENPVLLGVSFGGVLVQEMALHIKVQKVIVVSSVKSREELPLTMKLSQKTNAHKLLPLQWVENIESLALFTFGKAIKKRLSMYRRYLSERDVKYLKWSIHTIVNWETPAEIKNRIHIHGTEDSVFPIKGILEPVIKIKGEHAMIITQKAWFNEHLPALILRDETQEVLPPIRISKIKKYNED